MRKLVTFFSFVMLALAVSCSSVDAYVYLTVTGTNVNIRAEAKMGSKVLTQAKNGDMFIAEDNPLTNPDDKSRWYKIIMSYNNDYIPLEKDERLGVAVAYISANFVNVINVSDDEEKVISGILLGKTTTESANLNAVRVSNSREFLEALGSDRVIEMAPGKYNLSEWDPHLSNKGALKLANGVLWVAASDGGQLVLRRISNLTILGLGAKSSDTQIVIDTKYAQVLRFENCNDIAIKNLNAGDATGNGMCSDSVFQFTESSRIALTGVGMNDCGEGLKFNNVSDVKVSGSSVYKCTYQAVIVSNSRNVVFENCVFRENGGSVFYSIINVQGAKTQNISFSKCTFTGNRGQMFEVRNATVSVSNSTFRENVTDLSGGNGFPIQGSNNVKFTDCVFN